MCQSVRRRGQGKPTLTEAIQIPRTIWSPLEQIWTSSATRVWQNWRPAADQTKNPSSLSMIEGQSWVHSDTLGLRRSWHEGRCTVTEAIQLLECKCKDW